MKWWEILGVVILVAWFGLWIAGMNKNLKSGPVLITQPKVGDTGIQQNIYESAKKLI